MNINSFGGASLEEIKNFEKSIGFSLPDDYKQFLIKDNGGAPKICYSTFNVKDLNEDIPLDVLYGLNIEEKALDLQYVNDEFIDDIFPNSIIIGDDPGSGMIILINDNDFKGIYYWDYSFYFPQSSEEENTYKIANSFKAFINGLKNP